MTATNATAAATLTFVNDSNDPTGGALTANGTRPGRRQRQLRQRRQLHDRDSHRLRETQSGDRVRARLLHARPHQRDLQLGRRLRLLRLALDHHRQPRSKRALNRLLPVHPDRNRQRREHRLDLHHRQGRHLRPGRAHADLQRTRPAAPTTRARAHACTSSRTPPTVASTSRPARATATRASPPTASRPARRSARTGPARHRQTRERIATPRRRRERHRKRQRNEQRRPIGQLARFDLDRSTRPPPRGGALTVNGTAASGGGSGSYDSDGNFTIGTRTDYCETQSATESGLASSTLVRTSAAFSSPTSAAPSAPRPRSSATPPKTGSPPAATATPLPAPTTSATPSRSRPPSRSTRPIAEQSVADARERHGRCLLLRHGNPSLLQAGRGQRRLRSDRKFHGQRHRRRELHVPRRWQPRHELVGLGLGRDPDLQLHRNGHEQRHPERDRDEQRGWNVGQRHVRPDRRLHRAPSGAVTVNGTAGTGGTSVSYDTDGTFPIDSRTDYSETASATESGLASSTLVRTTASFSLGRRLRRLRLADHDHRQPRPERAHHRLLQATPSPAPTTSATPSRSRPP